jgi:DNA-binding transcriptional LysR family regulator
MERRDAEIFLMLAEELHFGRTAERLFVSQARVSQSIKKLERRIGAPLFERTSRHVALTAIGRQLYRDIAPAYRQIERGLARAISAGRGIRGVLRVGCEAPAIAELLAEPLDVFRRRYPECQLQIREVDFSDPFRMLRDTEPEVDALITLLPVDEPEITIGPVLLTEPMVLAVSGRHRLAGRDSVTLEDLASDTVLRAAHPPPPYWVPPPLPWHTPSGAEVRRGQPVDTFQELMLMVSAGRGICPLAAHAERYFARPNVVYLPFRETPSVDWGLVWVSSAETERTRAFADTVRR